MQNIFINKPLRLEASAVATFQVTRPLRLRVNSGCIWVTIEGNRIDYWLFGGQSLDLSEQGLVVIESINTNSELRIALGRRHWFMRLAQALGGLAGISRQRRDRRVMAVVCSQHQSCR